MQGSSRRRGLVLLLLLVLLGGPGCSIFGIGVRSESSTVRPDSPVYVRPGGKALVGKPLQSVAHVTGRTVEAVTLHSNFFRQLAERAMPAVVSIFVETETPYRLSLFPLPLPGTQYRIPLPGQGLGSGFFVHPDGYLLSNNHVIENARSIKLNFDEGEEEDIEAVVLARDPVLDIALLKVLDPKGPYPFLRLGDSEAVAVGDVVMAIGNPLGLGHTATSGIISQTGRSLERYEDEVEGRQIEFLQTDTAINPGSSGGPLMTTTGAVVGINTAILRGTQGIAFTVPSHQVREFLSHVLGGGGAADPAVPGS